MKSIIKENLKDKEINKFSVLTYNVYCGPPILPTKHAGCLDKS
jgi:hypothetical protein